MEKMNKQSTRRRIAPGRPLLSLVLLLTLLVATLALTSCGGHALRSQDQAVPASTQSQTAPASSQSSSPAAGNSSPAQQVQAIDQQVQGTLPSLDQSQNDANTSDQGQDNAPLP
ncbi:hypothetical protein [Thermogemmatispora sp.]|jgi:hypothetical protein|uniref:hypothetical protein n=1 Tax=Thermogemmatispora sp. TaxID=1968838 RepID=UPI0035E462FC